MSKKEKLFEVLNKVESGKWKVRSGDSPLSPTLSRWEREQVVGEFMSRTTAGEGVIDCAKYRKNFQLSIFSFPLKCKVAFTLAEVLITLGIIGVVAAITMPILITNMTERKNSERHANIAYKVTQAMEHMRATGKLVQYDSTESFVNELQKHLKIAKICDKDHIAECWPTDTVTDKEGNEFEVSMAQKGKNLSLESETNNVGIVLADGAALILNYNPALTQGLDVGDRVVASNKNLPVGNGKEKSFAYTSTVTGPIDFVMDVNGKGKPNSEVNSKAMDIRSFKNAKFSKGQSACEEKNGIEVDGVGCVVNIEKNYTPNGTYSYTVGSKVYTEDNNLQGAKDECSKIGMVIPDETTLVNIFNLRYEYTDLPKSGWFWWDEVGPSGAGWAYCFDENRNERRSLYYGKASALCVGD